MAVLGKNYIILWTSRALVSGLENVSAHIIKSNGVKIGPLSLVEYSDPILKGVYYHNYSTTELDPEGDWIIKIDSPEEDLSGIKRESFEKTGGGSVSVSESSEEVIIGEIVNNEIVGNILSMPSIIGKIVPNEMKGSVHSNELIKTVSESGLIVGVVNESCSSHS